MSFAVTPPLVKNAIFDELREYLDERSRMGTLLLECPLCCTETFTTPTDLKYHLLNMIDNLLCTGCGAKFNTIRALADHIDNDCIVNKKIAVDAKADEKTSLLAKALLVNKLKVEDSREFVRCEIQDESGKTVDSDSENSVHIKVEEAEEEPEDMFYCSSCDVSFYSVDKHLEEFHEGQEVFLEDGVNTDETTPNPEVLVTKNDETQLPGLETVQEEECTDKLGRLYTRKVVQIDKFWDEDNTSPRPDPIVQFYSVNDGLAVKIDKENEAQEQNSNVLQVYQCTDCSVYFTKEKQYKSHKCSSMKYQCTECDASFPQRRSLSAHMRMHTNVKQKNAKSPNTTGLSDQQEGPFICEYCSTPFSTYKSLRLHQRMHDPIKIKEVEAPVNYGIMGEDLLPLNAERVMFECPVCNKEYDEEYRHVHMKSHSEEENFDCDICNRKFFTQSNLTMHMRVHTAGKPHTCSYCKEEFIEYKDMQEHMKSHIETRPYQCQYCSRRFFRPHEKVKHERIHTGEKPHVCEVCGKSFRVSYCLTLHMRTHSGSRPYQCQECGKRFKAHSVYNHHLLIHSNVRKYKCPYCPKAFKTAVQLAGHKNTHTKPFTCTDCNRPFASLYAVRSHMETHKQENNLKFNCFACGASYARAFALRDHVKAHHEDQPWEEDLDPMQENLNATTSIISAADDAAAAVQNVLILEQDALVDAVELVDESNCDETVYMES